MGDEWTEFAGGAKEGPRPPAGFGGREGSIIAEPGDVLTCPNGHAVWRVVETVRASGTTKPECFRRLDCDEPPEVGVAPPCPTCGCEICPPVLNHWFTHAVFINGELARPRF